MNAVACNVCGREWTASDHFVDYHCLVEGCTGTLKKIPQITLPPIQSLVTSYDGTV